MTKEEIKAKVIYDVACEFGFGHYSTIGDIDYKFWEDIQPEDIADALADKIADLIIEQGKP
jgi:hypothetical protein